jgi:hypothetical protein
MRWNGRILTLEHSFK